MAAQPAGVRRRRGGHRQRCGAVRRQQYASAMPIITVELDAVVENGLPVVQLRVRNDGVGPAFIESGALRVNGREIHTLKAFRAAALSGIIQERAPIVRIDATRGVLAPGRERAPFRLRWEDEGLVEAFIPQAYALAAADVIGFEVCYCSIYRHCWITDIGADPHPERVRACPQTTDVYRTFMTETG
jgi:hypothetical protein